ncbi:hypothetical protein FZW96_10155 [Bacillus sp. BGMRC 2118]|nr:hypothetical protein FZW96_10155 [Bacillus sp. BGMRC 2118]
MKQVLHDKKKTEAEKRKPVLRLEVDYELATLYDALLIKDAKKIVECKRKLEKLRQEMIRLDA